MEFNQNLSDIAPQKTADKNCAAQNEAARPKINEVFIYAKIE